MIMLRLSRESSTTRHEYKPPVNEGRYHVIKKLGNGSFGEVYMGADGKDRKFKLVAIKFESKNRRRHYLHEESAVYQTLEGIPGIPRLRWFGEERDNYAMVMDLLGPSLEDIFAACKHQFSERTVLLLADQMIQRLQDVHNSCIVHRDIKPANFLMGINENINTVYIIDFGLSKKYFSARTGNHIPFRNHKGFTGTAKYASLNIHAGLEPSRRDDLEALGYVFFYFLHGSLPWQGMSASTRKQKYERISEKKMTTSPSTLCEGFPREFGVYLRYCKSLSFEETPNYLFLRSMFKRLFYHRYSFNASTDFDWTLQHCKENAGKCSCSSNARKRTRGHQHLATQAQGMILQQLTAFGMKDQGG